MLIGSGFAFAPAARRAKATGAWRSRSVRALVLSRALGWPTVGVFFVVGGVISRGWPFVAAVAVMVAMSFVSWVVRRRNGRRVAVGRD
jgi:hypothetical protein